MFELRARATAGQRSLWVMEQLSPGSDAYNIAFAARVLGGLHPDALRRAARALVARHDALRTTFREEDGLLLAVVHPELPPEIQVNEEQPASISEAVHQAHRAPFSLVQGPLLRLVVQRDGADHILLVTVHHAIADFQSLETLLSELELLYTAERDAAPVELPEVPQFVDAVLEDDPSSRLPYWRAQIEEPPPSLRWPVRPPLGASGTASHFFALSAERAAQLRAFCAESGASTFVVALAAWVELLGRVTGEPDWIVGAPSSLRPAGFGPCVGFFVNPLPLRLRAQPQQSFAERVKEALGVVMEGLEHRALPFTELVDAVGAAREPGRNPLFQTMVIVQQPRTFSGWASLYLAGSQGTERVCWAGHELAPFRLAQQEGQVDLALELVESSAGVSCVLRCRQEIVPASTLPSLARHLDLLLGRALREPAAPLSALQLLDEAQQSALLAEINPRPLLPEPSDDLVARFLSSAQRRPEQPAVTDGRTSLTYGELDQRSDAAARCLRALGVAPGDRVGVALPPGTEAVLSMLAALRAGAAYVPLDPAMPAERLRRTLQQAQIRHVVVDRSPPPLPPGVHAVLQAELPTEPSGPPLPLPGPAASAYTLFTSGSTGEPKGIEVRHGSVVALLDALALVMDTDASDTWSWFHAASFDLSVAEIWGALCQGGRLVAVPQEVRSRPDALVALLERERVTVATQTPSALRLLADELERTGAALPLRHVVSCGEVLPGAVARRVLRRGLRLWNLYGPAETTVYATVEPSDPQTTAYESMPIGVPMRHVTLSVRDGQGRIVPAGALGELWIGGHGVAVGYVGLPEQTAQKFVTDARGRWYRTGDLGVWDGERLHFHGRSDNQVKVRGYRIELDEVEAALAELEEVQHAVVVVETLAHGAQLSALVVAAHGQAPSEPSLRRQLSAVLPAYMVPSRIELVDALPLNTHGKLSRSAVRAWLAQRPVAPIPVRPDDPVEASVARIWCAVLSRREVGTDEGFFQIGGNSLALMRVYAELLALPGAEDLTPTDLFRYPTVRAQAERLRSGRAPRPAAHPAARRLDGASRLARRRHRD
jgi:amino acid adenylation domain-containing protein